MTKTDKNCGRRVTACISHDPQPVHTDNALAGTSTLNHTDAVADTASAHLHEHPTRRTIGLGRAHVLHVMAASLLAVTVGLAGPTEVAASTDDDSAHTLPSHSNGVGPGSNRGGGNKKTTDSVESDSGSDSSTETSTDTSTDSSTDTSTDSGTDTSTDTSTDSDTVTAEPEPVVETTTWYVALQAIDDKGQYSPDSNEAQGDLASGDYVTLVWEAPNMTLDGACTTVDGYLVKLGTDSGDYSHSVSVSAYDHGLSCTATDTNQCGSTYTCEMAVEIPTT
jgi:hypothetical protein